MDIKVQLNPSGDAIQLHSETGAVKLVEEGSACGCTFTSMVVNVSGVGLITCPSDGDDIVMLDMSGSHGFSFSPDDLESCCADDFIRENCYGSCPDFGGNPRYGVIVVAAQVCCAGSDLWGVSSSIEFGCSFPTVDDCNPEFPLESDWFVNWSAIHTGLPPGSHSFTDHHEDSDMSCGGGPAGHRTIDLNTSISIS